MRESLSLEQQEILDQLADRFEAEYRENLSPMIEDYLQLHPSIRRDLLRELLTVERELRAHGNNSSRAEDFLQRFPSDRDIVLQVFSEKPRLEIDSKDTVSLDDEHATVSTADGEKPGPKLVSVPSDENRIFGNYELLDEIARGGMGVVYRARQINLNRIVALKMILSGQVANDEEIQRFYSEAEAAAKLDHPRIVPIYEIGEHQGQHFFTMAFVDGFSLQEKIDGELLDPKESAQTCIKIADAVHFAHLNGLIHRDLKPGNVLIDGSGEPRVTDFGLAKRVESDSELTKDGAVLGTPSYMPPEQASGDLANVGVRSDVYALGAILFSLLTGRPPFKADSAFQTLEQVINAEVTSPKRLNQQVDRDLETICLKCLEKEPNKRYESADDFAAELQRYVRGEPIKTRPIGAGERIWRWCRRRPAIAGFSVAVSLLMVVAGASALWAIRSHTVSEQLTVIRAGIDSGDFSSENVRKLDTLITELAALDESEADIANDSLDTAIAASIEKQIRQPYIDDGSVVEIERRIAFLSDRNSTKASQLTSLLSERLGRWQAVTDLGSPFDLSEVTALVPNLKVSDDKKSVSIVDGVAPTSFDVSGNVRLLAQFAAPRDGPIEFAFVFHDGSQDQYQLKFRSFISAQDELGVNHGEEDGQESAELQILKNGQMVRFQQLDASVLADDVLSLSASREFRRISVRLNDGSPMRFDDLFPSPVSSNQLLHLRASQSTQLIRLLVLQQLTPLQPTPLERADRQFVAGEFGRALRSYEEQLAVGGAREVRYEALFKKALCLLRMSRESEALEILEQVSSADSKRWPLLAAAQTWQMHVRQKRFSKADTAFQFLTRYAEVSEIAPLIPQDIRETLLDSYVSHLRISYDFANKEEMGRRIEQCKRAAVVCALLGEPLYREHTLNWHIARGYEAIGQPDDAISLIKKQLSLLEDAPLGERDRAALQYLRTYSRIQKAANDPAPALRSIDDWIPKMAKRQVSMELKLLRSTVLLAQNQWELAKRQIESVREERSSLGHLEEGKIAGAELLGIVHEHNGNHDRAKRVWREAFEAKRELGLVARVRNRKEAWGVLMLGVWSDVITDDEIRHIISSMIVLYGQLSSGEATNLLSSLTTQTEAVSPQILRDLVRTPRGREFCVNFFLGRARLDQQYQHARILLASEFLVHGTIGRESVPTEIDGVIWTLSNYLVNEYRTNEIGISDLLLLASAWKGEMGKLGWDSLAQRFAESPSQRARLAYVLGHRHVRLGNLASAKELFASAQADAVEGTTVSRLASEDHALLNDGNRLVSCSNESAMQIVVSFMQGDAEVGLLQLPPNSEKRLLLPPAEFRLSVKSGRSVELSLDDVSMKQRLRQHILASSESATASDPVGRADDSRMTFAASFDGSSSRITVLSLKRPIGRDPITYEVWATPASTSMANRKRDFPLIHRWNMRLAITLTGHWALIAKDGDRFVRVRHEGRLPRVGQRDHVAGVWDGNEITIFVNGVKQPQSQEVDELFASKRTGTSIGGQEIAGRASGFHGTIDEIRVSSIARYRDDFIPKDRFEADDHTLALYHFDEGFGKSLKDSSGNGHHGKIINTEWIEFQLEAPRAK